MIEVFIPVVTVSELNRREHWGDRARRVRGHREAACMMVASEIIMAPALSTKGPLIVLMSRTGRNLLDDDNLNGALKAIRDGVADALDVKDNDPRIQWAYEQATGKPYGVLVRILAL